MRYTLLLHYQENDADSLGQEAIDEGQLAFAAYADVLHRAGVLVAAEVLEPASMTEPWFRGSSLALLAPQPPMVRRPAQPPMVVTARSRQAMKWSTCVSSQTRGGRTLRTLPPLPVRPASTPSRTSASRS
jgi:hypothetical protein